MKTYALALDLKEDDHLIKEYEQHHRAIWPEIRESILTAGVTDMRIYRLANRLFMIMEVTDDFSFDKKAEMDANNPKVQEWEALMWKYQQPLPQAKEGEKWLLMEEIFKL
ncbi:MULTISPECIES: L-rhamnose mutarotase [Sphingobacteriaceae]|uniref:L-rhamnose mutarotase n=1 Tax=Sphingobacterium sp. (strain 21) TaxID=743722 RepID=F4C913_SPHS2|nr:L-rhamnose mutarotase [Pseudosphingobacterium sp.]